MTMTSDADTRQLQADLKYEAECDRKRMSHRNPITHAEALRALDDLAHLWGFKGIGVRTSRKGPTGELWMTAWDCDGQGWPDRLYLRPKGTYVRGVWSMSDCLITVEVKVGKDRLREHQTAWDDYLSKFRAVKNVVLHWDKPEDRACAEKLFGSME